MDSSARLSTGGSGLGSAIEGLRSTPPAQASLAVGADTELGRIEASLASGRLLLILPLFFLLGIGLSFTPCVLPMVPILSFIIVGDGERPSRRRGFVLSLTAASLR
jgi:thiol:disulfide interchange protein DsbD